MRTPAVVALALAGLLSVMVGARADGVASPITLEWALSRAQGESYEARIARLEVGRAEDAAQGSRGAYLPQLSLSAQAGYSNRQNERFTALDQNFKPRTYGLSNLANDPWLSVVFDQVLLDLRRWRELERSELEAEIATISEREHAERVAYDVVRRFAELERVQNFEAIARDQHTAAVWLDEQAEQLAEAGRALEGERTLARIELDAAALDLEVAALRVDAARGALWLAIEGGPEPQPWPGTAALRLPVHANAEASGEAGEDSLQRAPDLQLLELQRRVYEKSIEAAKASRYPSLQLRGGYAHYGINRYDNYNDEAYVFVGIELPIFDGFQSSSEIAGARKGARVARLGYRSALDAKRLRVRDLRKRLAISADRVALAKRRAAAALEAQRLADLQLKSQRGRLDQAQVARQALLRDRLALGDLRFERAELWATLQRELGRLTVTLQGPASGDSEGTEN